MIPSGALKELSRIVGPDHLFLNYEDLLACASDGTKMEFMPDAVVYPADTEEISQILALANMEKFPVIPRGAGTGMSGGALPVNGGLVISMTRLDRILSIDQDNLIARVEPGVITARLQEEVERVGLFYPPDPASFETSTIGGNVAECAGGLRAVKYGVTRDYVLGLTAVLPTGEIIKTGVETAKGVAGYDLTRLLVGSEGTLAIITGIILRLITKPAAKKSMVAFFPELSLAVQTVSSIIKQKVVPTTLEFLDRLSIDCVREEMGIEIPVDANAMLLIEVDGDEVLVDGDAEKVKDACLGTGAIRFDVASDKEEVEQLWAARREVSPSLLKLRPGKINEDVVVPRSRLADLVSFLGDLSMRHDLPIPAFGHAGDGNIHVNIMLDKENRDEVERAELAVKELFERVLEMGGTITGEHGVGITKAPYMDMEFTRATLDLMCRLKRAFDPNNILNPGKILTITDD